MATIPSVTAWTAAQKITATKLNAIHDYLDFTMTDKPLLHVVQGTAQTGWTTATFNAVTFTAADILDRDAQHSTSSNTSRVVIGTTLGWYKVTGTYGAAANSAATLLRASLGLNGTRIGGGMSTMSPASSASALSVTTPTLLVQSTASGDYVELFGYVVAGSGTLGTSVSSDFASSLTVEYVGKS
jgi:hypothetical protein